jgi:predicted XRE-type DNA-binding protein
MRYSNAELIEMIEYAKKNKHKLTHITDKSNLSYEDKFKLGLCKHVVRFANRKRLTLKKLANMTGIPDSRFSEMANYKINKFTVDQLLKNLFILSQFDAQIKAYLDLLSQAVDIPTLKVADTKRLTKNLKEGAHFSHQVNL